MKRIIRKIIPESVLSFYHLSLAFLAASFYLFPSRKIKVVGVTGTNGKTTTVDLISSILKEAGYETAVLSSIKFKIKEEEKENDLKMTMPGRFKLQKFLRQAVNSRCCYAVIEVSSEGIKQYRHKFISFHAAVFTNLSPEHIEAHKSFENYKRCKGKLFRETKKIHIINYDDEHADYFLQFKAEEKWLFSLNKEKEGVIKAEKIKGGFIVNDTEIKLQIPGEFNIYNALASLCFASSQKVSLAVIKKALESYSGVPGRMETVINDSFKVIIDYAVTPTALEKAYQTVGDGLVCVLGSCGGGRDKWKRPLLGEIACRYCREVIVTNEDPYDEDPIKIINQVAEGCPRAKKILDRSEAIREALNIVQPNETIIITGKGCEPWICLEKGKKIPWSEKEVIKQEYGKR